MRAEGQICLSRVLRHADVQIIRIDNAVQIRVKWPENSRKNIREGMPTTFLARRPMPPEQVSSGAFVHSVGATDAG